MNRRHRPTPPRLRREPQRTCVGCRQEADQGSLIRVVRAASGGVRVDVSGDAPGRGAYVHRSLQCLEAASKRRTLDRSLHTSVPAELWSELRRLIDIQ